MANQPIMMICISVQNVEVIARIQIERIIFIINNPCNPNCLTKTKEMKSPKKKMTDKKSKYPVYEDGSPTPMEKKHIRDLFPAATSEIDKSKKKRT